MTVGICTVAYGETYHAFLPEWSQHVAALETKPTSVTIVHDGVAQELRDTVNDLFNVLWVEDHVTQFDVHPQYLINTAISVTRTDWIIKLDADDLILPHALNAVKSCQADVLNYGYRIGSANHASQNVTREQVLERSSNYVSSCSPFRRWLWERNPFRDMLFDDWGFWFEAAREGATFAATGTVDYVYRVHDQQMTRHHDNTAAANIVRAL